MSAAHVSPQKGGAALYPITLVLPGPGMASVHQIALWHWPFSFLWIFLFSVKHCLPPLQFPYLTPLQGVQTGVIVNKGAISWLRQTSVDAVARLAANVLAGTVFQKMTIGKDLPLIKCARLKRQLKQPNGF